MRRKTKLMILTLALTAVCGFAAYAAGGWVQDGSDWIYTDSYGDPVYNTWKQSGDAYYYLGDDGIMVKDQLITDGSSYYYAGADGRRVTDQWVKVAGDDTDISTYGVDYRWYYFSSTGKAYTSSTKSIGGKKYRFGDDGKMLFGFVDDAYNMVTNDTDPILSSLYYFGTNEDGAMVTGWYQTALSSDGYDSDSYWFYFNTSTGKKTVSTDKTISSRKYHFDTEGIMTTGWLLASNSEGTPSWKYYNGDGALQKSTWVNAVPDEGMDTGSDYSNDTYRWFYTDTQGCIVTDKTKKINSKWYIFDEQGRMKSGLAQVSNADTMGDAVYIADLSDYTAEQIIALDNVTLAYFSDSSSDGSAKNGTIKIELEDDTYTFYFAKNYFAADGIVSKRLYVNGILQCASSDDRYAIKQNRHAETGEYDYYLVNASGAVFTSSTVVRDGDENYIALYVDSADQIHYVKIASGDYASAAANYFRTNGNWNGYDSENKPFRQIGEELVWELQ